MHDFDTLWNYGKPDETEQKFRELLGPKGADMEPGYHLELQTQIARTLGLQQKYAEAHQLLDDVESRMTQDQSVVKIRYLLERGRVYNSSGTKDLALPLFKGAWELGLQEKADFYAVDAAHMVAIAAPQDEKLAWNEKAMELAERSPDSRAQGWLGSLYNNIGWTYHDQQDYDKAMEVFLKALAWRESKGQEVETRIARWCVARTHRSLGNIDEALAMQLALEREILDSGAEKDGYVYEEIGECLRLQGDEAAARPYFKQAYEQLSQDGWLVQNEAPRLERLKSLGGM